MWTNGEQNTIDLGKRQKGKWFHFHATTPEEIFSSSFAAAAYLEKTNFVTSGKKVYVIGERGISEELDLIGVPWVGGESFKDLTSPLHPGGKVEVDKDVAAVIVGFDRYINYYKLQYAQLCLNGIPGPSGKHKEHKDSPSGVVGVFEAKGWGSKRFIRPLETQRNNFLPGYPGMFLLACPRPPHSVRLFENLGSNKSLCSSFRPYRMPVYCNELGQSWPLH